MGCTESAFEVTPRIALSPVILGERLEFLHGRTSVFIGFDDRFVGTRISALGRFSTVREGPRQEIASMPLRWMTLRSFNDGPLGRFSPISHF